MNLREPPAIPADRPLGVLIHTRYSTDEQSQSSLDGQINVCQRFLTANIPRECRPEQANVEIIREPEISGEIADRPGINQVWAGIKDHRCDVILAEESSRLYRHMTYASQRFDTAIDSGNGRSAGETDRSSTLSTKSARRSSWRSSSRLPTTSRPGRSPTG